MTLDGRVTRLFEDGSKWTQDRMAKDANGRGVSIDSPNATCWCLLGAIQRCYGGRTSLVEDELEKIVHHRNITTFNDNHTYDEVVSFCRRINL